MAGQNEDVDYQVSEFATPDKTDEQIDDDQPNKSVLLEVHNELEKDIAENNSFSVITIPANATPEQKIAAFDDMAIHKGLALYLTKYKIMIEDKIKELR